MTDPYEGDGYCGPATLVLGGVSFDVQADLRGQFQPIDGRYHWYGRLARNDALTVALALGRATATLSTPSGTAECELSDPDPWRRYRVSGISTPPFAVQRGAGVAAEFDRDDCQDESAKSSQYPPACFPGHLPWRDNSYTSTGYAVPSFGSS